MEPLAGFGLACGVLQIVDFSAQAIKTYREFRSSPISAENASHVALTAHLDVLAKNIAVTLQEVEQTGTQLPPEDIAFQPVVHACAELAKALLSRLQTCGVIPAHTRPGCVETGRRARARAALRTIWSGREIDDMANRLQGFRNQIVLHMTMKNQQKLDGIAAKIAGEQAAGTSSSSVETHQLCHSILTKLASIEQSVEDMKDSGVGATRRSLTPTSRSATSVEISSSGSFTANHYQCEDEDKPGKNMAEDIRDAFELPWEDYQEAFLEQVRKEIKGTARAELETIKFFIGQALAQLHDQTERLAPSSQFVDASSDPRDVDISLVPNPYARGTNIGDIDSVETSTKTWVRSCPVGSLSFDITRRQHFLPGLLPIRTTVSRLVFTPMASWLTEAVGITTGVILQYESRRDTRAWPSLFPSLETFRVLSRDDEVWGLLRRGDVGPVRDMFAEGVLHHLDRNSYGRTLLHHAANHDHLELCRFLASVGCRATEADMDGMLPEDLALLPKRSRSGSGVHLTYRFLRDTRQRDRSYLPPERKNDEVMVARICRTAMVTNNIWYIRPWVIHCSAQGVDLTKLPLLLFNLCLRRESRSIPVWHPFLRDAEKKAYWNRRMLRGLFDELCRTELLPCNPAYGKSSLLHLVVSNIIDLFQTNVDMANGGLSARHPRNALPRRAQRDFDSLVFVATSIARNGGDLYIRDHENDSVTDYFRDFGLLSVWEEVLLASGFLPVLVLEEDRRRKEGVSAAATTHDFRLKSVDFRSWRGMRRRTMTVF